MLIWIKQFELERLARSAANIDGLSALGEAGYHGRHAVLAPRPVLAAASKVEGISRQAKSYFDHMAQGVAQLGALFSRNKQIVVDMDVITPTRLAGEWHVPLSMMRDNEYLAPTELLCESMNDCCFLIRFAEIYLRHNLPSCVVKLRSVAGGGNNTADTLREMLRDPNASALCVVDSDRELPMGRLGDTAKRCSQVYQESWRVLLHILDCRELENMVPNEILVHVLESIGSDADIANKLPMVAEDLSLYACFKTGESPCRFHQIPSGHVASDRVRTALNRTSMTHPNFRNCGNDCADCDCQIFPRLGENFLRTVTAWIDAHLRHPALRPDRWTQAFQSVVGEVASAGLAFPRRIL